MPTLPRPTVSTRSICRISSARRRRRRSKYYADFGDISGDGFADVTGTRDETLAVIGSDEWEPTLFINGEGKVCMISEVMSPVGRYNHIFVL